MTAKPTRSEAIARLTAPGQPYELRETLAGGRPVKSFVNAPPTLPALYAATCSESTFLVYENERLTFADAYREASAIARLLVEQYAVAPGDRVAIAMRNYPDWITIFTAVTSIGAIAVAVNALWQSDELSYGLRDSGARVLFADQERLDRLSQRRDLPGVSMIAVRLTRTAADVPDLQDLIGPFMDLPMPKVDVGTDDPATIFYTSGSTDRPKGVVSTHRNILSALFSWELDGRIAELITGAKPEPLPYQHATLLAVPLFHVSGSHALYLQSYRAQRKLVSMYKWDPDHAAELIERERITSFIAPSAMTGDLERLARQTSRDLTSLLTVGGGGAPRPPEQVRKIAQSFAGAIPNTGWGMTETNAIGTNVAGTDYLRRPSSSGRPSAIIDLKIVDETGRSLAPNERGELLVRGASLFVGYWNRPDVNSEAFHDGWFRTGDVAYLDEDGYLFIVDRIKDLIIRGGENIGCGHVEAALLAHPDVHEAAAYAVPDERLGEEVGATVYGSDTLEEDDLRDFLSHHLARFEIPRYLCVLRQPLPRTASGKILKRELRQAAMNDLKLFHPSDHPEPSGDRS